MSHKLLLADDSVTIQRVVELTFSGEDVEVVAVSDGEQAIARIPIEKPDIVLADIGTPKRSGYDVAAFVKGHPELSHVPVLLLAGAFEPVDEERAKQVKCDGVLVKPFEPQQVIARVRALVDAGKSRGDASAPAARPSEPEPRTPAPEVPPPSSEAPVTIREPRMATPEPLLPGSELAAGSLEEYFDRLDAAFATLGHAQSAASVPAGPLGGDENVGAPSSSDDLPKPDRGIPTIEDVLGGASLRTTPGAAPRTPGSIAAPPIEPADTSPTLAPVPRTRPAAAEDGGNVIADIFNQLFAVERGEAAPARVRGLPGTPVEITDELLDQLTRRILARLAPDTARAIVADIVSEVAERLVREEIERIRRPKA